MNKMRLTTPLGRRHRGRWWSSVAATVAIASVAAACGGSPAATTTTTTKSSAPQHGGTLKIAVNSFPVNLSPVTTPPSMYQTYPMEGIFGLLGYDDATTGATHPFNKSPLSHAFRSFTGPILYGSLGSRLCKNSSTFSHGPVSFAFTRP